MRRYGVVLWGAQGFSNEPHRAYVACVFDESGGIVFALFCVLV